MYFKETSCEITLLDAVLEAGVLPKPGSTQEEDTTPPCQTHFDAMSVRLMKRAIAELNPEWYKVLLKEIHMQNPKSLLQCILLGAKRKHDTAITQTDHCERTP